MSSVVITKCDHCGKRTDDVFAEHGWLKLAGTITLTAGRTAANGARTGFVDAQGRSLDFCGMTCFSAWITTRPVSPE